MDKGGFTVVALDRFSQVQALRVGLKGGRTRVNSNNVDSKLERERVREREKERERQMYED